MPLPSLYKVVFEQAHHSIEWLWSARHQGETGEVFETEDGNKVDARWMLQAIALFCKCPDLLRAIQEMMPQLEEIGSGEYVIRTPEGPRRLNSALMATTCLWVMLRDLLEKMPGRELPDGWQDCFGIDGTAWHEGLRREQLALEVLDKHAPKTPAVPVEMQAAFSRIDQRLEQLTMRLAEGQRETTPAGAVPGRALEAMIGNDGQQIITIARSSQSADDRMRAICAIDRLYLGWDSSQWAELLGVKSSAIRQTHFWKIDRQLARKACRD